MTRQFHNPFNASGNWYKGSIHFHTTNSDGMLSAHDMVARYTEMGFHFLSITDHNKLTQIDSPTELLLIPGMEVHSDWPAGEKAFHFVALNIKEELPSPGGAETSTPQQTVNAILRRGGLAILAHPYWSALTTSDCLSVSGYLGLEVCNTSGLFGPDKAYSMVQWDNLLFLGKKMYGFAVDDSHASYDAHTPDATGTGWIMVKANNLSTENIIDSIRKGMFYSSCGPEIKSITFNGNSVTAVTSAVRSISFIGNNGLGKMFSSVDRPYIETAEFTIPEQLRYLRIQCIDSDGRMAWSNPAFFGT